MARNARRKRIPRDHSIENRRILRQSFIERVRENLRIVAIAPNVPAFRSRRFQNDQFGRIPNRQPPQQYLIEQGKDRRIRADAQRQRQNRNEGKARILPEHPQAVAHVLQERVHLYHPPPGALAISYRAQKSGILNSEAPSKGGITSSGLGQSCPRLTCPTGSPCPRPSIHPKSRPCSR